MELFLGLIILVVICAIPIIIILKIIDWVKAPFEKQKKEERERKQKIERLAQERLHAEIKAIIDLNNGDESTHDSLFAEYEKIKSHLSTCSILEENGDISQIPIAEYDSSIHSYNLLIKIIPKFIEYIENIAHIPIEYIEILDVRDIRSIVFLADKNSIINQLKKINPF